MSVFACFFIIFATYILIIMDKRVKYNGLEFEPYITRETIAARVAEIAARINADCAGQRPLFLCVLNGAFPLLPIFSAHTKATQKSASYA